MAELAPQQQRRRTGRGQLCTCRPSITISHVSKWNLQLFLKKKTTHSTDCARHTDTTTWSFGLRALSPRMQAMLGFRLGGRSLSMVGKISPHNIVDPLRSPAFIAMEEARRSLREFAVSYSGRKYISSLRWIGTRRATSNGLTLLVHESSPLNLSFQRHVESTCATLRSRLLQAFASGTATPADRSPEGITILYVRCWMLWLVDSKLTSLQKFLEFARDFNAYQEAVFDLLSSTLEILIPNNTGSSSYP